MGFIDPRTDFGFKRIFGSTRSKSILRNFLNAIVYNDTPRITDLEIVDPYQNPDTYDLKQSILDVKVVLDNGTTVLIEMQILPVEAFAERVVYNTAKAYVNQLQRGQPYLSLRPVISLTITDFVLFPDFDYPISRYQLLERGTDHCCSDHLELIFAELPKLTEQSQPFDQQHNRWLYFIQQAGKLEDIPSTLANSDLNEAFAIANESQLSREEYELSEKQRLKLLDDQGRLNYAIKAGVEIGIQQGLEQGLEQGLQQGLRQGLERGLEQGLEQGRMETARRMLKELDPETVSRITGLPIETVRTLEQETNDRND